MRRPAPPLAVCLRSRGIVQLTLPGGCEVEAAKVVCQQDDQEKDREDREHERRGRNEGGCDAETRTGVASEAQPCGDGSEREWCGGGDRRARGFGGHDGEGLVNLGRQGEPAVDGVAARGVREARGADGSKNVRRDRDENL